MPTSTDPTLRDKLILVDANQVGDKERLNNPDNFHPMFRHTWESSDQIRSILGRYRTIYTGSKGLQSYNYASVVNQLEAGGSPGGNEGGTAGLGPLRHQLQGPNGGTNIVFDYSVNVSGNLVLTHGANEKAAWNNYSNRSQNSADFLRSRTGQTTYGGGTATLLSMALGNNIVTYQDTTSIFSLASEDKAIRTAAGYNLDVEPVYNYYTSTTPPYEDVIGKGSTSARQAPINPRVKEYHLPNIYFLQSELNNTSSIPLALYHLPALTLNHTMPWFEIGNAQTVGSLTATENDENRYYDLYAEGIQGMLKDDGVSYQEIDTNLNKNNRNFVVLHSDLGAVKEDRITQATIPFYNKIILGNDPDNYTGKKRSISILQALYNDPDTRDFLDILQMQTVLRLTTEQDETSESMYMASRKNVFGLGPHEFANTSVETPYKVLYDFNELFTTYEDTNKEIEVASIINGFAAFNPQVSYIGIDLETLPFRLIRDYQQTPAQLSVDPAQVSNAQIDLYQNVGSAAAVSRVVRSFEEVLHGMTAHTETLMYIVRKKTSPAATEAIQTFYISPEFRTDAPTVYFDTQVKYDTNYYYEIDKVVLVFGTQYQYVNLTSVTSNPANENTGLPIEAKIQMETAPAVKALVVPYTTGDGMKAIIIDKPPVPPEIRFYPYKGINDKLKILLNSSTGRLSSAPVIINESDKDYFVQEYRTQTGDWSVGYDGMVANGAKIAFRSDDPVDAYEVFRLTSPPSAYTAFAGTEILIDPVRGVPGSFEDTLTPNTKYYYCARSIDVHGNRSNPTHIYEIEIVDNNGQIFIKQRVFSYEHTKEDFIKDGRRFIYIEPTFAQTLLHSNTATGTPSVTNPPGPSILGDEGVDSVWGKEFKVRLTSKKTGRKVDLNLTFKNSGIVNASE
jgi:hypothetical protein